jgi:cytochrome P450
VSRDQLRDSLKVLNGFIRPFVDEALQLSPIEDGSSSKLSGTFLESLARCTRDPVMIRDQLVSVLFAGRDTTAATLSWTFFELSRRPDIYSKLRALILESVGSNGCPTYNDLKNHKFLTHVINETLRLYPVVPFNFRTALCDTTLPKGGGRDGAESVGIPKGTRVAYSALFMQRRVDLYPPSQGMTQSAYPSDRWEPQRWESWTPTAWHYIPFNGGPRICVGQNFAMVCISQ